MIKIDLITGFLGSGKTTFLKKYAKFLMQRGENIAILENDFGAVNVDMMLLQDLMGDQCELEMVAGGCHPDCHRRRFKTKLIAMGMCGYDRVLIEPSGIYDVDEFFDALHEEPLDKWYEIGNVIAIVDAKLEKDLSEEAEFLLASEAANAGRIVISKSQEASEEEIARTLAHLNRALEQAKCRRRFAPEELFCKNWEELTDADWEQLLKSGYVNESYRKLALEDNEVFDSLYFMNRHLTREELETAADQILHDPACGDVFRMKGFLRVGEKEWLQLNATKNERKLSPIPAGQEVLIVIGENLNEAAIGAYLSGGED